MNFSAHPGAITRVCPPMNRFLRAPLALGLLTFAGCAASPQGAPTPRSLAASFAAGHAYDDAQLALQSGDDARLAAAGRNYTRALNQIPGSAPLREVFTGVVPQLVESGMTLDLQAQVAAPLDSARLGERALQKYRAASALLPRDPAPGSVDGQWLNAIGYSLAERGTSRADLLRAEQLTRLALAEWDRQIKKLSANDPRRANLEAGRFSGPLDSHAWALFRLGRFEEAVKQQEKVMDFARENPDVLTAELPFHLAEIYRALGRDEDARREYNAALTLNPNPELTFKIDAALNGKIV